MKVMIKVSTVLVFFIMVVSCASTPRPLPEKYHLDLELEAVDKIWTIRDPSWEEVDDQSVILKADRRNYYLLVLRRPMDKRYSNPISLSNTSYVTPGFDHIIVRELGVIQYYVIEKIYRLKGREQAEEIKERFRED